MADHFISITNDRFVPEETSAQHGDNVTFQLGGGRTAPAFVTWATGLFASTAPTLLEVTHSVSPTQRIEVTSGAFDITTESVKTPITGKIRVGSSESHT